MPQNNVDKYFILNIFWLISGVIWIPIYCVLWVLRKLNIIQDIPKWVKWWGNRVDNLPDALMEWIHCHKIPFTKYQLNIAFMMKNRGKPYWPIIRECYYPCENCDPEDKIETK